MALTTEEFVEIFPNYAHACTLEWQSTLPNKVFIFFAIIYNLSHKISSSVAKVGVTHYNQIPSLIMLQ
jgi:hypothetical protein